MPTVWLTSAWAGVRRLRTRFDTYLVRFKGAVRNFMVLCVLDRLWRLWPGPTSN